jgi:hypothetical protein
MYLPLTLNHFRAVKAWADSCDAQVSLDIKNFELEVKFRNRYYTLKPRFVTGFRGRISYAITLVKEATGFVGWLPYEVLDWDFSKDKILFKKFLEGAGVKTPEICSNGDAVNRSFLRKSSLGSFGYQIAGPYRKLEELPPAETKPKEHPANRPSVDFLERFVVGTNLKVWFWGTQAIYAHVHPYPTVLGDGVSTLRTLIDTRLGAVDSVYSGEGDQTNLAASLKFQGVQPSDVLEAGREVWLDFRYGRRYEPAVATAESDNDLAKVNAQVRGQIDQVGAKVGAEAMRRFKAPVLYSLDGVVDADGVVWWLEVNSNPMLPPEGYPFIFMSLFGSAKKA